MHWWRSIVQTITTEELKKMRDHGEDFVLINVLPEKEFQQERIPDSKNIPVESEDFVEEVEQAVGDKESKVVVYCASSTCDASTKAAERLEAGGFSNVLAYEGGMKAWRESREPVLTGA